MVAETCLHLFDSFEAIGRGECVPLIGASKLRLRMRQASSRLV